MRFPDQIPLLKPRRAHEVCGAGALSFALMAAARHRGTVMFVDAAHSPEQLQPWGAGRFVDMSRFLIARGQTQTDILWIAEEALRSGCVPMVIARVSKQIDLTAGRRLQLAAEMGGALGLFIIPEGMGSNATETRWRCTPVNPQSEHPGQLDSTLLELNCIKNKTGTLGSWTIRWNDDARDIDCLSQTGDGPLSQAPSG